MDARAERAALVGLLSALEAGAEGQPFADDNRADTSGVLAVARHHRLSPLLSIACRDIRPPALAESFRRDRVITTARNLFLRTAAEECIAALEAAGIRTIVLKGLAYEVTLYADAGARATGDVDLLVPAERRRDAFQVMNALGFEPRAAAAGFDEPDYHEVAWTRAGVEVDLHMMLAPTVRGGIDHDEVWARAAPLALGKAATWTLAADHAAAFHALHMAIDHFAVPAIYLVDLARLLDSQAAVDAAEATARRWRLRRPLLTAVALTAAFLPTWGGRHRLPPADGPAPAVVTGYGSTRPLPRLTQLERKLAHFDTVGDAARYLIVQGRRKARELLEKWVRKRSARERLSLGA